MCSVLCQEVLTACFALARNLISCFRCVPEIYAYCFIWPNCFHYILHSVYAPWKRLLFIVSSILYVPCKTLFPCCNLYSYQCVCLETCLLFLVSELYSLELVVWCEWYPEDRTVCFGQSCIMDRTVVWAQLYIWIELCDFDQSFLFWIDLCDFVRTVWFGQGCNFR